jgi:hypothetical protein
VTASAVLLATGAESTLSASGASPSTRLMYAHGTPIASTATSSTAPVIQRARWRRNVPTRTPSVD